MNYIKRWAPLVALIVLFLFVMSTKAGTGNLDRGDWLTQKNPLSTDADVSVAHVQDAFTDLREYLEQEEALYLLRQTAPASLIVYYDFGEETTGSRWSCKAFNLAFPGISLKTYTFADIVEWNVQL